MNEIKIFLCSNKKSVKEIFSNSIAIEKYGERAIQVIANYDTFDLMSVILQSNVSFARTCNQITQIAQEKKLKLVAMQDLSIQKLPVWVPQE